MSSAAGAPGRRAGWRSQLFLHPPAGFLAVVISIIVTLLGVFAIRLLPMSRYPQITPPAVTVQAVYPGATAEDVAEAVAAPIEQQLSGASGPALLLVGQLERRDHDPADLLRR